MKVGNGSDISFCRKRSYRSYPSYAPVQRFWSCSFGKFWFMIFINLIFLTCHFKPACHLVESTYTSSDDKEEFNPHSHLTEGIEISKKHISKAVDDDLPILLWWTNRIFPHERQKSYTKIGCELGSCLITANRKYAKNKKTHAFLFYGTDIKPNDLPLPRKSNHLWALFHEESPLNNYILCHEKFLRLFNFTSTCRRESDFPITTQFILDPKYFISRLPVPLAVKNEYKKTRGYAPLLYIQSHCAVPSDRDRYVKELMKFIEIDSYGACLQNKDMHDRFKDPPSNLYNDDFLDFIAPYKFHLAFENAYLEDYMTEKLMRTLYLGSIPVYKGAPNAHSWMPSNKSVIYVDDFATPKDLATFIKKLDEDDLEYESYLKYKTEGISNQYLINILKNREWSSKNTPGYPDRIESYECYICDRVTEFLSNKRKKYLSKPKFANKSHFGCSQPYTMLVHPQEVPHKDV